MFVVCKMPWSSDFMTFFFAVPLHPTFILYPIHVNGGDIMDGFRE
jgi:hypothetical protein